MKSYRCHIDLDGMRLTETGKRKVWHVHLVPTYCCALVATFFVWEKSTKYNNYSGYGTYVHGNAIRLL